MVDLDSLYQIGTPLRRVESLLFLVNMLLVGRSLVQTQTSHTSTLKSLVGATYNTPGILEVGMVNTNEQPSLWHFWVFKTSFSNSDPSSTGVFPQQYIALQNWRGSLLLPCITVRHLELIPSHANRAHPVIVFFSPSSETNVATTRPSSSSPPSSV